MPGLAPSLPPFDEVLVSRKSVRAFRPEPVETELLGRVFEMASLAPSNCNTQPWRVYLVSGETRDRLAAALTEAYSEKRLAFDIPYLANAYTPELRSRQGEHVQCQQDAFGISRDDAEGRARLGFGNMKFWGAPHIAFLCMPAFGNEREAADVGMFAQSAMLAATALGLATCPQTSVGLFAGTIKAMLGIDETEKLLFGLAIGYEDSEAAEARLVQARAGPRAFLRTFD